MQNIKQLQVKWLKSIKQIYNNNEQKIKVTKLINHI